MYIFHFTDEVTRDEVLGMKLWHIANKSSILRRWVPGMQLLKLSLESISIWIKITHLPLEFWNSTCLSYIASGVGRPLYADSVTEEKLRLGYARVLVEVNTQSSFAKEISVYGADGKPIKMGVEYPWLPLQCKSCKAFGHAVYSCPKVEN